MRTLLFICCLVLASVGWAQDTSEKHAQSKTGKAEAQLLASLEKKQQAAKVSYTKNPNAANQKQYVAATDKLAYETMTAATLEPKVKYPKALKLYRTSLKVDPHDREAIKWVDIIETIYKNMHRPIPK